MSGLDPRLEWINRVGRSSDLPTHTRHVAVMIAATLGWQLAGAVSIAQLVALTGLSYPSVKRATAQLRRDGWLTVLRRGGRGHASQLRLDVPGLIRRDDIPELGSRWAPDRDHLGSAVSPDAVTGDESRLAGEPRSAQLGSRWAPDRDHLGSAVSPDAVTGDESRLAGEPRSAQLGSPASPLLEGGREGGKFSLSLLTTEREPADERELHGLRLVLGSLPEGLLGVDERDARQVRWEIVRRVRAGVPAEQLSERADAISKSAVAQRSAAELVRRALEGRYQPRQLPAMSPLATPTYVPSTAAPISWCGQCDELNPGWLDDDSGRRCPRCHPSAAAVSS